ncbi:phosphohistidine phosphatase SixA [Bisgaard Taxon 45]|uniref:Phosphohistidine phosphatase SixA n=1 Tax=Bisgaard Taxon 45 TaxID=304289 RepID=A0ABT9KBB6_9PAST|nr:phosphohistidine phosphatase SixA [Bisgaard Taxon 45]
MDIFVMRHGEAEMMAKSDKERHLNLRGIQQAISQGEWLKSTMMVDKVLVSPYVRAQQTFEQINDVYAEQLAEKMETWDHITPYGNSHTVLSYLALLAIQGVRSVLIVSHLPLVGEIVFSLCGHSSVSFYPSTITHVQWDGEIGNIVQVKYPE